MPPSKFTVQLERTETEKKRFDAATNGTIAHVHHYFHIQAIFCIRQRQRGKHKICYREIKTEEKEKYG